jgi:phage terminase large subunit-like protein
MRHAALASLTTEQLHRLRYNWSYKARDNQLPPPGDWRTWLVLAGRGFGKTRTGAEWLRAQVETGACGRVALVAPTAADARDVMVEGESGILAISPPWCRPKYEPSKRRLTWPNGAQATVYSADEPDRLRGPQHDGAWCDELAAWNRPEAWDMLQFGLRLGDNPRAVATTTPKPVKVIRDLLAAVTTAVTRGSTYENAANLATAFLTEIRRRYEGTRLGRQELNAELLDDVPGALWVRKALDDLRVVKAPELVRVVIGIDPAVTSGEDSDETGIVALGKGIDGHGYVLADRSCRLSPDGWARRALTTFDQFEANQFIAEVNNGGDLVASNIHTARASAPVKSVRASRGKYTRAEPIAALYEQGRMHHVGSWPELEDQMCSFTPEGGDGSPDRADALVWAATELMLGSDMPFSGDGWDE